LERKQYVANCSHELQLASFANGEDSSQRALQLRNNEEQKSDLSDASE
jgi:hypothetical protein